MTIATRILLARIHAEWARQLAAWLASVADADGNADLTHQARERQTRDSYATVRRLCEHGIPVDLYLFSGRRRLSEAERRELLDNIRQLEVRGLVVITGDLVKLTGAGARAIEFP